MSGKGTTYVHYGHKSFQTELFGMLRNRMHTNKPYGGLWASAKDAKYGWKDWCEESEYRNYSEDCFFTFTLKPEARVLVIDSSETAKGLPERKPDEFQEYGIRVSYPVLPDFEKLKEEYDVIDFRLSSDGSLYRTLYGWDCDSILVLDPDVVIPVV